MHLVTRKKIVLSAACSLLFSTILFTQSVGINTATPHNSAILDVKSNTKGMLTPRTSTVSRMAIASPAKGLMLYDTTTSSFWFYNGTAWSSISAGNNVWSLTGNAAINPANQFIGTADAQPLRFRVNNSWAGEIHPTNYNIFLGLGSGQSITTGEANTAIGTNSLNANSEGSFNTASGYYALPVNTVGFNNTAFGGYALSSNTVGRSNTGVGRNALFANTTGEYNTAVGEGALLTNTIAIRNTATGYNSLRANIEGNQNTATGSEALRDNTYGYSNTAMGSGALSENTTGFFNTAIGQSALAYNSTANYNTAVGSVALTYNTTGRFNTATGVQALAENIGGNYNTASGGQALSYSTTGNDNTAIGYKALYLNNIGNNNVASGSEALQSNTNGSFNTATGYQSLYSNTIGWYNTAVGYAALTNNIAGLYNIAIGYSSGTGGVNAAILNNTVGIGNTAGFLNGASNQVILGNASTAFIGGKVNWAVVSDARIKNTVEEDVKGLPFILKLRPVTYHISNKAITTLTGNKDDTDFPEKYDGEKIKYTGFLAQDVERAAKASGYDFSGYTAPKNEHDLYTIRYAEFVVPLVKAMQEQQLIITDQQKKIDDLEKRLLALETKR